MTRPCLVIPAVFFVFELQRFHLYQPHSRTGLISMWRVLKYCQGSLWNVCLSVREDLVFEICLRVQGKGRVTISTQPGICLLPAVQRKSFKSGDTFRDISVERGDPKKWLTAGAVGKQLWLVPTLNSTHFVIFDFLFLVCSRCSNTGFMANTMYLNGSENLHTQLS